jgi:hypothetical protein
VEGEDVSEDGCNDDEEGFWKSFAISALLIVGLGVEAVVVEYDAEASSIDPKTTDPETYTKRLALFRSC